MFDDSELNIPCPGCQAKAKKTIGWIKHNSQFVCAGCGNTINLQSDELLRGLKEAEQTIENFKRKLGNIKLNIKL